MSEYKEQQPLLYEISDEEYKIDTKSYQRRSRFSPYSERSRAQIKGAALIIKNWPDHLSGLLIYWWIGFGMVAVTIFIIYNSVAAFNFVTPSPVTIDNNEIVIDKITKIDNHDPNLDVFMHVFVKSYEEMNNEFYLPYIKTVAKKYPYYKYNFIVVLNDILANNEKPLSDDKNNQNTLKTVLSSKTMYRSKWNDISVQYISLTNFLDRSPVKEYWRHLPFEILQFLIRCISIWNNGAIAFNPILITPKSPNPLYMDKVQNVLKKFVKLGNVRKKDRRIYNNKVENKTNQVNNTREVINVFEHEYGKAVNKLPNNFKDKVKNKVKQVNNIRDIINVLENEDSEAVDELNNLSEAENQKVTYSVNMSTYTNDERDPRSLRNETLNDIHLEKPIINKNADEQINIVVTNSTDIIDLKNSTEIPKLNNLIKKINTTKNFANIRHLPELTIDVRGNLIATKLSCHAFIGSIFSNAIHYSFTDTIKDFIIDELSMFCNNTSSFCNYLDLILM